MKRLYILILLFFGAFYLFGQVDNLLKLHDVSVIPNTGQMQCAIKLAHLKDPDFDIPIYISYTSDGFRPLTYSGIVGKNWSLYLGGSISRQIIGLADDYANNDYGEGIARQGFLEMLRQKDSNDFYSQYTTVNDLYEHQEVFRSFLDASSDIYTFSANGLSGTFVIGWDGKAKIITGDFVRVDIDSLTIQEIHQLPTNNLFDILKVPISSKIRLTDMNGYKYVFGGNDNALEYTYDYPDFSELNYSQPLPVITAWHLVEIIAPNDRRIRFHYNEQNVSSYDYIEDGIGCSYHFNYNNVLSFNSVETPYLNFQEVPEDDFYLGKDSTWGIINHQKLQKTTLLDSISTSDNSFSIYLNYLNDSDYLFLRQPMRTIPLPSTFNVRQKKPFLEKIKVQSVSNNIAEWNLLYNTIRIGNKHIPRHYLSSCKTNDNIGFSFEYDFDDLLGTESIDTLSNMDAYGYICNDTLSRFGSLKKVRDMLGGITSFSYQPTKIDSIRIFLKNNNSVYSITRQTTKNLIHSLVIKDIEVRDMNGEKYLKKSYSYEYNPYKPSPLLFSPKNPTDSIYINRRHSYGTLDIDYAVLQDTSVSEPIYTLKGYLNTQPTQNTVHYSKVEESIYNNGATQPTGINLYFYDTKTDSIEFSFISNEHFTEAYSILSQSKIRNRLYAIENYDRQETLCKRTTYKYSPTLTNDFSLNLSNFVCKIYYSQNLQIEKGIKEFYFSGNVLNKYEYQYDSLRRVIRIDHTNNLQHSFTTFTYPDNYFTSNLFGNNEVLDGIRLLTYQNRIGLPVETAGGRIKNNVEYITSATLSIPKRYGINGNPNAYSYVAPYMMLNLNINEPIADFQPFMTDINNIRFDQRYDTLYVYSYNRYLRPIEIIKKSEPTKQLTWDNKNLNIISESIGNRITSQIWNPYVGIKSQTDPRGNTVYYRYNQFGQVVETYRIRNGKKEVLNICEYNYPRIK